MTAGMLFEPARSVSLERQIECVRREIRIRQQTYPTKVARRRMSQHHADEELACMKAVMATLIAMQNDG
jgi:hypothetical protein